MEDRSSERRKGKGREARSLFDSHPPSYRPSYPYDDADAEAEAPDLAGSRARASRVTMSSSSSFSSKPPPHLLHVDTTATTNGSAASPGSASSSQSSRSSPRPSPAAGGSGQNQACAACKYQRRKCNPDCSLAPYFPAENQRLFLNAHRLFGVRNIQKTLQRISPEYGPEAMRALIYQSEARAADPVYGCVGIIKNLEHKIHLYNAELEALHQQIAIYRQAATAVGGGGHPLAAGPPMLAAAPGQNNLAMTMHALYGGGGVHLQEPVHQAGAAGFAVVADQQAGYNALNHVNVDDHGQDQHQQQPHPLYDYFCYDGTPAEEATSHDATMRHEFCYSDASATQTGSSSGGMTTLREQLENHCQIQAAPFVDAFDDVKPHGLPVMTEHHSQAHGGGGGIIEQPEQKVLPATAVVKYDDADQNMADDEPAAPAAGQCHLELGSSSFLN